MGDADVPDAVKLDVTPPGFHVLHQPRSLSTDKRGGGVTLIYRNCTSVQQLNVGMLSQFEVLAMRLTLLPTVQITVVCTYRPPGTVTRLFYDQFANILTSGDFNCPGSNGCLLDSNMADTLLRYDLVQHIPKLEDETATHSTC